jgi:serine/threonine protein kinase
LPLPARSTAPPTGAVAVAAAGAPRQEEDPLLASTPHLAQQRLGSDQDSSPSDSSQGGHVSESDSIDNAVDAPPAALRSRSQQDMHTPFVPHAARLAHGGARGGGGGARQLGQPQSHLARQRAADRLVRTSAPRRHRASTSASRTKVSLVGDTVEVRHTLAPTVAAVSVSGFECAMKSVALPGDASAIAAVAERCAVLPLVAALNQENVMRVVGYNMTSDTQLLVFSELCDQSLAGYLAQQGDAPLSDATLLDFAVQIAVGIRHIHFHSIMHRDINAKHVLIKSVVRDFSAGSPAPAAAPVLKLGSFGAACSISGALGAQQYRASVGDADFMAPEVATGTYDESCDIWSFGALLFTLLAHGRQPRLTLDGERLSKGQSLPLPAACNALLVELYQKCTSLRPAERPTATQLCTRLGSNFSTSL